MDGVCPFEGMRREKSLAFLSRAPHLVLSHPTALDLTLTVCLTTRRMAQVVIDKKGVVVMRHDLRTPINSAEGMALLDPNDVNAADADRGTTTPDSIGTKPAPGLLILRDYQCKAADVVINAPPSKGVVRLQVTK